jgi:2-polyprenyl-3-methyl-5-hydroxy-6-metoxy-1,4-benzoquinol methylase
VNDFDERLRRSWDANASVWRDAIENRSIESRRLVTDAAIVGAVLDHHPRRVLDLGCGEGWLARELAAHALDVVGVDGSQPLIDTASAHGSAARFMRLGYEEIVANPMSAGSDFDAIVANFSLLDDRAGDLLAALRPALSSDGHLIVQSLHPEHAGGDISTDGWRIETFEAMPGTWPEPMPWYYRTRASWETMFASAGYALVETREPMHPVREVPASILWILRAR